MAQGNGSADYKARTEPDGKGLLGAGTTKQEGRGQRKPTDGLESQHGTANVEPKGAYQCGASGRQYGTIDNSNSWNAVIISGWGKRAATSVVGRSTPRSKKGPTTKGKYAKGQGTSNSNNKKGGNASRKTKINNAGSIYVVTNRTRRGGNETMENLDVGRKRHVSSVCTKRRQATSAVEGGRKTTKVNTRRTVE